MIVQYLDAVCIIKSLFAITQPCKLLQLQDTNSPVIDAKELV